MSSGWVAKVIRGEQENLTYSSLEKLLAGFSSPDDKELLYQTWLETYAPSPAQQFAPDIWSQDEQIFAYAQSVHEQISAGKVLQAYRSFGTLWNHLKSRPYRWASALATGHAYIHTANQLDRPFVSLAVLEDMTRIATEAEEPAWKGQTLWLRGVSLRLVRPQVFDEFESEFSNLADYLGSWRPTSVEGKQDHRELSQAYARDSLLSGLDALNANLTGKAILSTRIKALGKSIENLEATESIGLASEVLARALIVSDQTDEASKRLEVAKKFAASRANQLKVRITKLQLHLAIGDQQVANERLESTLNFADKYCLVHQRNKLALIEQKMRISSVTCYSVPT
jgi:hypothetical protein